MNKELYGNREKAWVINPNGEINWVRTIKATDEHLVYWLMTYASSIQEPRRAQWADVFRDEISAMTARRDRLQSEVDFWTDQIAIAERKGNVPKRKATLYG